VDEDWESHPPSARGPPAPGLLSPPWASAEGAHSKTTLELKEVILRNRNGQLDTQ
jgi:hypothetical protein